MFDLVIQNAKIYDGMGGPFFYANLGISNGTITKITRLPLSGSSVIDASGLILTPGFIDPHGHADNMLDKEPRQQAKIEQGITTSLGGLCGESAAPSAADGKLFLFSSYLDRLAALPTGANIGLFVGAGALRSAVMGFRSEKPSDTQMAQMEDLLRDALDAGAFGLSFGLAYPPSSYFDCDDMIRLCRVVADYDGLAAFHLRNEGDSFYEAVDEALAVARGSGCRLILSHHKAMRPENWGKTAVTLGMMDRAADEGLEIYSDAHPYTAISAGLRMYIPKRLHAVGLDGLTEQAGTEAGRKSLIRAVENTLAEGTGQYKPADVPKAHVLSSPSHPEYNGRRLADIAEEQGRPFADVLIDLLYADKMQTMGMHVDIMNQQEVARVLSHPRVMPCTDGSLILPAEACHPRVRGSFPRFLGRMCIQNGLLPIETAVMKMTSLPARIYRLPKKGIIREGMDADLVLIDPVVFCDHATVSACKAENSGLRYVFLKGQIAAENNRQTDLLAGSVLRYHP